MFSLTDRMSSRIKSDFAAASTDIHLLESTEFMLNFLFFHITGSAEARGRCRQNNQFYDFIFSISVQYRTKVTSSAGKLRLWHRKAVF